MLNLINTAICIDIPNKVANTTLAKCYLLYLYIQQYKHSQASASALEGTIKFTQCSVRDLMMDLIVLNRKKCPWPLHSHLKTYKRVVIQAVILLSKIFL